MKIFSHAKLVDFYVISRGKIFLESNSFCFSASSALPPSFKHAAAFSSRAFASSTNPDSAHGNNKAITNQKEEFHRIIQFQSKLKMPSHGIKESGTDNKIRKEVATQILKMVGFKSDKVGRSQQKKEKEDRAKRRYLQLAKLLHPDKLQDELKDRREVYDLVEGAKITLVDGM